MGVLAAAAASASASVDTVHADVAAAAASSDVPAPDDCDVSDHEQHRPRRRSSGAESTLAPLPTFVPTKVFPRDSFSFSISSASANAAFGGSSAAHATTGSGVHDSSSLHADLQVQTANYETILRHFNLRKLNSGQASIYTPRYAPEHSVPARSGASGSSTRHIGAGGRSPLKRHARLSLHRSLKQARHQAFNAFVACLYGLRHPIAPTSAAYRFKDALLFCVYCFQLLYLPFAPTYLASHSASSPTATLSMIRINVALEVVYLLEVASAFNTCVYVQSHGSVQLVSSRSEIARQYLRGSFLPDVLSALPLESLMRLTSSGGKALIVASPALYHVANALRVLQWPNFVRTARSAWVLQSVTFYQEHCWLYQGPHCAIARVVTRMLTLFVLTLHYCTCGWHAIVMRDDSTALSLIATYLRDARRVIACMTGSGSSDSVWAASERAHEDALAIALLLVGVLLFAYVLGRIAVVLATRHWSTSHGAYERQKLMLAPKMHKLQLPQELQDRIHRYYEHLWREYDATSEDITGFTRDLTRPLALEVGLCRYMNLVVCVPFWSDCSPDFVSAVVLSLRVRVYLPDDYVVRKSEIGTEFFMIHRGVGEVTGYHRETTRVANGAAFGEVALLLNCKRATSVRALTYMEICVLQRAPFLDIVARYHSDRRRVVTRMLQRGFESNEHPQLWQEVLLRRAHAHDSDESKTHSASTGLAGADKPEEPILTATKAAEILADAIDLIGSGGNHHLVTSPPPSVHEGLLRWSTADPSSREHCHLRKQRTRPQSTSSCSSAGKFLEAHASLPHSQSVQVEQGTTASVQLPPAGATMTEGSSETTTDKESHPQQHQSEPVPPHGHTPVDEHLELLRSLAAAVARMEDKLGRVEKRVSQIELSSPPPLVRSGSIDDALIAVTVPSLSRREDFEPGDLSVPGGRAAGTTGHSTSRHVSVFDNAAGSRYESLMLERPRRAFSLDVDGKQHLTTFHMQQQWLRSGHAHASSSGDVSRTVRDDVAAHNEQTSSSFRLQPRRRSKSTLADQLWRINSTNNLHQLE